MDTGPKESETYTALNLMYNAFRRNEMVDRETVI